VSLAVNQRIATDAASGIKATPRLYVTQRTTSSQVRNSVPRCHLAGLEPHFPIVSSALM
jgi:hypothetical protein